MTHTGTMSYLSKLHRTYGVMKYDMFLLEYCTNGKLTVVFKEKE